MSKPLSQLAEHSYQALLSPTEAMTSELVAEVLEGETR